MNLYIRRVLTALIILMNATLAALAQIPNPALPDELVHKAWPGKWIAVAGEPAQGYGVYHFRKKIELPDKPASFLVHVSADNRYKLFVNEQLVSLGPAQGDVHHWNFETVDLAPFLKAGSNTLAAVVWNHEVNPANPAAGSPLAQLSLRTGFIMQGNGLQEQVVNTNKSWKGIRNPAYAPIHTQLNTYFVIGPGEQIEGSKYLWGWEKEGFDDSGWKEATEISPGLVGGLFEPWYEGWHLQPRTIPAMELSPQRLALVRKATGINMPKSFPQKAEAFTVPARTKATLILDQGFETTAYPMLTLSGGEGAVVTLSYAESMFVDDGTAKNKGNRNEVEGKVFVGYKDSFVSDGGKERTFTPLWWRTYRYIELNVETQGVPLIINDLYGIYTGYPFKLTASFRAKQQPELNKILETGWRTARLCAHETYMDCPYYEQLQYVGDTRIQALVSLFNSGDDRLMRNAIIQIRNSHGLEGITQSRFPSRVAQYIPTFSLWWIAMVNDYLKYRGDLPFIKEQLPVSRAIISFFESKQQAGGSLGHVPYWSFTDWASGPGWKAGMAPKAAKGHSAALDLQLLLAYQAALSLEKAAGMAEFAAHYQQKINELKQSVRAQYWDKARGLFADTPEKKLFSQHANVFAVLGGVAEGEEAQRLMNKVLTDTSLTQATIYFRFYLNQAVAQAGLGDLYLSSLGEWQKQLALSLSTWAEEPEPTRSDCHAWGASPNIELYRIVLGIDSDAPGFSKVKIAPHLGYLKEASGEIPHPKGKIRVQYRLKKNSKLEAVIQLPQDISGEFLWKGVSHKLASGENKITL
jgi:alpha-L-rhamnosidase